MMTTHETLARRIIDAARANPGATIIVSRGQIIVRAAVAAATLAVLSACGSPSQPSPIPPTPAPTSAPVVHRGPS